MYLHRSVKLMHYDCRVVVHKLILIKIDKPFQGLNNDNYFTV